MQLKSSYQWELKFPVVHSKQNFQTVCDLKSKVIVIIINKPDFQIPGKVMATEAILRQILESSLHIQTYVCPSWLLVLHRLNN